MLSHRLYYALKPFVPWRLRMGLRRIAARRKLAVSKDIWPINPTTNRPPAGWPGWPGLSKFAFVITHDVEGPEGLAKVRQLAELEMKLGFRSSFNFIPEGPYRVPADLRQWLTDNGFEVGVHDLHHDGKLFASRRGFLTKARRINHYLKEWQASGYRSGFMLRNLDWLHDLSIRYDSSTFDTDPFEPQSEGSGTIFPYWIPSPFCAHRPPAEKEGYVELPYTLPQDSTLFFVLQKTNPDIWLRKLDWIAGHGGMALINIHPDYMNFGDTPRRIREYDAEFYATFLRYVSSNYQGQYWNQLPGVLAGWFRDTCRTDGDGTAPVAPALNPDSAGSAGDSSRLNGKRVAVLLYSHYPSDPRPRRAAEAMIEAGMEVDLYSLAETENEPLEETVRGVRIFRVPLTRSRASKWSYLWGYGRFLISSFWFLVRQGRRSRYDLVHVHNMPDVLVFSSLFLKLKGAKVILDLHDPMPEVMMTIYGLNENRLPVRLLKLLERWSIGFADAVLTVNLACHKIFSARSCSPSKIRVIMNSPDEGIFRYQEVLHPDPAVAQGARPFVVMYHGSIVERHGLDLAVTAIEQVLKSHPRVELRIYGRRTPFLDQVMALVREKGLEEHVRYLGPKSLEQIVEAVRECDVGIIPNRRSLFTEINTPTRIFEYLALGKPLIAPRAQGILDYFGPDDLFYFQLGDTNDLARAILEVIRLGDRAIATVRRGQRVYLNHCWSSERHRFLRLVAEVLEVDGSSTPDPCVGVTPVLRAGP